MQPHHELPHRPTSPVGSRLAGVLILVSLLLGQPLPGIAAERDQQLYELPADSAERALKRLAAEAGVEIILSSTVVAQVRTNPVSGKFAPLEAATRMLAGTGLKVEEDEETRALIVSRMPATRETPADKRQAPVSASDEIVHLEEYRVSTTVGRYVEETTSAGSKMPVETKNLPATVQIFNASAIKDRVAETLDDIYPYVVGMSREAPISNGFNIRGFTAQSGGTQQNLQIDNLPGSASRYSSPSTVNVERLEIIKGPTSVLYGKLNPGGLVNIVTKRPKEKKATVVSTSITSYAGDLSGFGDDISLKFSFDQTGPIDEGKRWLYRLIASVEDVQTWRPYGYLKNLYIYPSLTYRWSPETTFTAQWEVVREKRQYDNSIPYPPFNNPQNLPDYRTMYQDRDTPERDSGDVFNTSFQHEFANDWKLSVGTRSVYHKDRVRGYRTNQVFAPVTGAQPVGNSRVRRVFFDRVITRGYNFTDANVHGEFATAGVRHTLLLGVNGGVERSDSNFPISGVNASGANAALALFDFVNYYQPVTGLSPVPAAGTQIAPRRTEVHYYNYGAYVSDRMQFGQHWYLLLGLRHDRQDSESIEYVSGMAKEGKVDDTLPTVGLVYEASSALTYYVSFNKSFRPAPADANVDENGRVDFPPETGRQLEVGIKSQFFDNRVTATFSAYQIVKENVLEATGTFTPAGLPISRIQGEQESRGWEVDANWQPVPNWQLQAGASFIDAQVTKSSNPVFIGRRMVGVARHSGSFWTRYNVPNGMLRGAGFGLGVIRSGQRLVGTPTTQTSSFVSPGYTRLDFACYYQWRRHDFALNVTNLADRSYLASSGENAVFPADPRRITLSANLRF